MKRFILTAFVSFISLFSVRGQAIVQGDFVVIKGDTTHMVPGGALAGPSDEISAHMLKSKFIFKARLPIDDCSYALSYSLQDRLYTTITCRSSNSEVISFAVRISMPTVISPEATALQTFDAFNEQVTNMRKSLLPGWKCDMNIDGNDQASVMRWLLSGGNTPYFRIFTPGGKLFIELTMDANSVTFKAFNTGAYTRYLKDISTSRR